MTIKRIGPISCAKIAGVTYAAFGLIAGALVSVFALIGTAVSSANPDASTKALPAAIGGLIGAGAIIVFPIFYGLLGFVFALIGAWLYNLVASKVGGIEVDIS